MRGYTDVQHAILEIYDQYNVRVGWEKSIVKTIDKWGQTETLGSTLQTVWGSPATNETYATDNTIDSIVCTDNNFTGSVTIEYHTLSAGNLTFGIQSKTLTGQTPVLLSTPVARISRAYITGTTSLALSDYISVYDSSATTVSAGVPQTAAGVHITVRGGQYRQSEKASTSIDSDSYYLINKFAASIGSNKTASAEVYLQKRTLGNEFRAFIDPFFISSTNSSPSERTYSAGLIIEPNSDIRVLAATVGSSPASDVSLTARLSGILLRIV